MTFLNILLTFKIYNVLVSIKVPSYLHKIFIICVDSFDYCYFFKFLNFEYATFDDADKELQ